MPIYRRVADHRERLPLRFHGVVHGLVNRMGIDVSGWVEVKTFGSWDAVIRVAGLADRNYDLFSCLFGVADYARFVPIAAARGLPADLSEAATDDYLTWDEAFGETRISWPEIGAIDWDEDALDTRPHVYRRDACGELVYEGKYASRSGQSRRPTEEGACWEEDGRTFRIERITRQAAMEGAREWSALFGLMSLLASEFGDEAVRLVVWFDR